MGGMDPADLNALEKTPLFQALPKRHRGRIARLARVETYQDGEVILQQGDLGGMFVMMLSGSAVIAADGGDERVVVSDEYFGELSLIDGHPRSATVTAMGPAKVARLGREDFRALLTDEPALAAGLLPGVAAVARDLLRADAAATPETVGTRGAGPGLDAADQAEATPEEITGRDALGWLMLARHVGTFQALNEKQLRKVAKLFSIESYADRDTVILAGAPGDSMHVVLNGRARVRTPSGHSVALGADACFGELALIDGAPRSATVTAVGALTTAMLTRPDFSKLLKAEPGIAVGLLDGLVAIVRDMEEASAPVA
jgi:CRP/FNR family transcriptional regulator, cyclic AMP receptor protein